MARFDVHENGSELLLDCQANALDTLNTRLAVPLQPPGIAPLPAGTLNPKFVINGQTYFMVTQFAAAVPTRALGPVVASLRDHEYRIANACDMLLFGI